MKHELMVKAVNEGKAQRAARLAGLVADQGVKDFMLLVVEGGRVSCAGVIENAPDVLQALEALASEIRAAMEKSRQ